MKKTLLLLSVVLSSSAFAGMEYGPNSKIPQSLRQPIAAAVAQACTSETSRGLSIVETETVVGQDGNRQTFSSFFTMEGAGDIYHPANYTLLVESQVVPVRGSTKSEVRLVYGCKRLDYDCTIQKLNMYNGSVFNDIDAPEIHKVLLTRGDGRRFAVVEAASQCFAEQK